MQFSGDESVSSDKLSTLFDLAGQNAKSGLISDALSILEKFESDVVSPARIPSSGIATPEEERDLFAKLKGTWRLQYHNGSERLEISDTGLYSLVSAKGQTPRFQLKLIALNSGDSKIELAKDFKNSGRRWDIEVLKLDDFDNPQCMKGQSKDTSNLLIYSRM